MSRHMRTTVRLNDALLNQAKREAAKRKTTLTALMEQGLRLAIAQKSTKPRARIELPVWNSGGLQPGVDIDNMSSLLDIMDGIE